MSEKKLSRRDFLRATSVLGAGAVAGGFLAACGPTAEPEAPAATSAPAATEAPAPTEAPAAAEPVEVVHWSWLGASDAEVWKQMIENFNEANENITIRMESLPDSEYDTKAMSAVAAGQGPGFGWTYPAGGLQAEWIQKEIIVPLDDLVNTVGLDMDDFVQSVLDNGRYPAFDNKLYEIPIDVMTMAFEINTDHVEEAGLDINNPPQTGEELIEWAKAMTVRDGDTVTRSGLLLGPSIQNTVTWGVVSGQMGYKRASDDLTEACINPEAGIEAMNWILAAYNEHKVSTLEIADRYKAFGAGQGAMFMTGPWTVSGYIEQGTPFVSIHVPKIGDVQETYLEVGSLEIYKQPDEDQYVPIMEAVKWLSDNSFLWTTVGRGAAARTSILEDPAYSESGLPWEQRGAFVDAKALEMAKIPIGLGVTEGADDFVIYSSGNYLAETLDSVWYGDRSPEEAMDMICAKYTEHLEAAM